MSQPTGRRRWLAAVRADTPGSTAQPLAFWVGAPPRQNWYFRLATTLRGAP